VRRDEHEGIISLGVVFYQLLRKLPGLQLRVFSLSDYQTTLRKQFAKIQEEAGIRLDCRGGLEYPAVVPRVRLS